MNKYCIISGGLGYIGSHLCYTLSFNYKVIIIDNLSNSKIDNLKLLTNKKKIRFIKSDIKDSDKILEKLKKLNKIDFFVHLSADKYVASNSQMHIDSILQTISVLKICRFKKIKKLFYSSSAAVYGHNSSEPISHYGKSKLICESLIRDFYEYNYIIARIFNPFGSNFHKTQHGELAPVIDKIKQAIRTNQIFTVFTNNQTKDKSGYRDFIEINEVVRQFLYLIKSKKSVTVDICTGKAISVISILDRLNNISYNSKKKSDKDISFSRGKLIKNFKYHKKDIINKIIDYINN